jgi:segregation and condensation protein B
MSSTQPAPADTGGAESPQAEPSRHSAESLAPAIEAVLLSADRAIPSARLAIALGLVPPPKDERPEGEAPASSEDQPPTPPPRPSRRKPVVQTGFLEPSAAADLIDAAVESLNAAYEATARSFRIESVSGGYRVMTLPAFAGVIQAYTRSKAAAKLSRASIESLAVIAYRQPMTRAELESIRGVACGEVLRALMERRLITIKGRAEELGRPMLYGTTKQFLDLFGLSSLTDLPQPGELKPTP